MNKLVSPSFCVSIMLLLTSYTNAIGEETSKLTIHQQSPILKKYRKIWNLELKIQKNKLRKHKRLINGNSAWMITATALVLFMTLPGLALFNKLVQSKMFFPFLYMLSIACYLSLTLGCLWI